MLTAATLVCAAVVALVMEVARLAERHADRLWALVDRIVPGRGLRARTYLFVHLALGFVLLLGALAFAAIARDVSSSGPLAAFDRAFAVALRGEIDPVWRSLFWGFTWLGSYFPVTVMTLLAMWRLLSRGRRLLAVMWVLSQTGGLFISEGLKETFARPRPEGADPFLFGNTWSFPSGHAVASVVLCGVGAYILLRTIRSWRMRALLVSAALAWCFAMGFSRLYLGVHYVSDVAAGFLIGSAWVAICISAMEVIESQRSGVEGQR